jgi:inorganic pyrophosphatase/exopolyphosphatase
VDISDPKHFANFVNEEKIVKLYDHRFWGKELYWKEKLGNNAVIESVGACATLIWEEFIKTGVEQKIDKNCANLIYMDIVIHTLNLQSLVATERDKNALNCLKPLVSLPRDFAETYYSQVNESFMKDPEKAMRNDTKIQEINSKEYGIIQVELWDSRKFIEDHENPIIDILKSLNTPNTFLTSPSIAEGYNYVVTTNDNVKKLLEKSIGVKFDGNIGRTPKLLLRKEIIKILIDYTSQTPL